MALKILFADDKGIVNYAKIVVGLNSINTKIIISDILFLLLQLIELFPTSIVYYIRSIMVNANIWILNYNY